MTSSTLQLDPRFPLVWRSPTSLQVGVDHALVRFDDVSHADEAMLHALGVGIGAEGLWMIGEEAGATADEVARFVERVRPVLQSQRGSPFQAADLVVEGDSACALSLRRLFAQLVAEAGAGSGDMGAPPDLVVLVAAWAVRPAQAARWLRRDVAHLPVVFSDQEVRIGPLVTPGNGPCVHCAERAAADRDEAWPAIASQLLGRRPMTEQPLLVATVTSVVARLTQSHLAADGRGLRPGRVVHVNAETGVLTETARAVHPECACRALPETAMGRGSASGSPPSAPTTGPGVDEPG